MVLELGLGLDLHLLTPDYSIPHHLLLLLTPPTLSSHIRNAGTFKGGFGTLHRPLQVVKIT
jgi:hypothetical protein